MEEDSTFFDVLKICSGLKLLDIQLLPRRKIPDYASARFVRRTITYRP